MNLKNKGMNKPILTTRVTCLESFRKWMYGQTEQNQMWNCEANVIDTIKGVHTAGQKADYGTAGHAIIEQPGGNRVSGGYKVGAAIISDTQAAPILKHVAEHPLMTREIHLSKLYTLPDGQQIILTGTTDAIEGMQLRDTKFKFGQFTMAEYMESTQWRCYLDMIGLDIFWYDFFKVTGFEGMHDCPTARISECESLMVVRYPEMEQDVFRLIVEFVNYVQFKQLTPYLQLTNAKRKKILKGNSQLKSLL